MRVLLTGCLSAHFEKRGARKGVEGRSFRISVNFKSEPVSKVNFELNPHPTVLVLVEKLWRDCRWVPRFVPHFVTDLLALGDVDKLVLNAFAVEYPHHFSLLGLHLGKQRPASFVWFPASPKVLLLKK